ncbi:diguanylate cyclase [Thiomicrorhabdus sp. 6S3-12]|uniref:diguanylate cyclase n=1 Tax=Thiomicrorhabdus sp. 6S3-12 TaxID=2819681 RepID=UPI001AAD07DA|nr:diguanylate cyclase [Thiomicrorhabdus sp. 6S3-12]MBO1925034.1 diguanylate cyclase [Thiomicrorhabdus sp. 6S3-12]
MTSCTAFTRSLFLTSLFVVLSLFAMRIQAAQNVTDPVDRKQLTPVKVQLNWHHQFQFAGFYAAIQQGYYHQSGLDVELLPWSPGVSTAQQVEDGKADFGISVSSVLIDIAKGKDLQMVMTSFQYSPLVLLSHFPLTDLEQFAGKTVMHNGGIQVKSLLANSTLPKSLMPKEVYSSGNLQDFIDGKVDFYGAYVSNEPFILRNMRVPFYTVDPKRYGIQSYSGLVFTSSALARTQPDLVEKFRKATIKGWEFAIAHPQEVINYLIQHYPVDKSQSDLLNEAKSLKEFVQVGSTPIGHLDQLKILAILSDALNLGIISQNEYQKIKNSNIIFDKNTQLFTYEEQQYLKNKRTLVVSDTLHYPPFNMVNAQGESQGLVTDYMLAIKRLLGVEIISESQVFPDDNDSIDLIPAISETPALKSKYLFTKPYLSFPLVLVGRGGDNSGFIQDFSALSGYSVAVLKDSFPQEYLTFHYPNINLVQVGSLREGLRKVQYGEAIALADNLVAINYAVQTEGYTNFQIIGQSEHKYPFSMAVNRDEPLLYSIIQKALQYIKDSNRQIGYQKWLKVPEVRIFNYQLLMQLMLPLLLVIILLTTLLISYHRKQRYLKEIYELSYASLIDATTMKIIWSSKAYGKLSGYETEELAGMPYLKLASQKVTSDVIQSIYHQVLDLGKSWSGEVPAVKKNGEEYWVDLTLIPNKNLLGKVTSVLATRIDISDRKKIEAISITDELTGLYNRRYFQKKLVSEIQRAKREKQSVTFIMLDIDFFKKINDDYGHLVGDEVLIEVSTSIHAYFNRANDFVFRVGGEEFFIISYFDNLRALKVHLNNLQESIRRQRIENRNAPLGFLTLSMGVLYCDPNCIPAPEKVSKRTDDLLYESKENGRDRISIELITEKDAESCVKQRVPSQVD